MGNMYRKEDRDAARAVGKSIIRKGKAKSKALHKFNGEADRMANLSDKRLSEAQKRKDRYSGPEGATRAANIFVR